MKHLSSTEIRNMWLEFFKSKGHHIEESASLIPQNDPTLLWTNAGVTPLKKYFDGTMVPVNPRITNAQKCIRTNDIENVGKTARHHTFFEMLGNFSIGDYFKKEAIEWAVELLFDEKWFGFEKDKIYITYYTNDLDCYNNWLKNGISPDHLIPLESNFWCIGEGPSGPDTEMFYDRGEKYDKRGKELIEQDIENDRFIEIWNIVFSQFNAKEGIPREQFEELPSKNIDTGCGLERLCCVMQEVDSNYDTDLFMPIIRKTEELSKVKYEGQMAFKVIADHVRTVTFAVADGATLANEGRGYVLRRVLRRAMKYAKTIGLDKPFMAELVDVVVDIMKGYYPYLVNKASIVKQIITNEEKKFFNTLASGEKRLDQMLTNTNKLSGKDAFLLYDTYGFPLELTCEICNDRNIEVDTKGFYQEMEEQRERARNSRKDISSMSGQNEEYLNFKEESTFVGYDKLMVNTKVIKKFAEGIVLKETPFYATSGGEIHDTGVINGILVTDVKKLPNGQFLHVLEENTLGEGDEVLALVDENSRHKIEANHSAAHLLQRALQVVLGEDTHQQGQQVTDKYVRFDFNNYKALTDEEILKIEALVLEYIKEAHPVTKKYMPIEEAKKIGAMALFGEKYGDVVRVVDMEISKEFCGGCHVNNTKDIKDFMITSYESIGSGIFRITAVTGLDAYSELKASLANTFQDIYTLEKKANNIFNEIKELGKEAKTQVLFNEPTSKGYQFVLDLRKEANNVQSELHNLEKELNEAKRHNVLGDLKTYEKYIENNGLFLKLTDIDKSLIKDLALMLQNNYNLDIVTLALTGDNLTLVIATSNRFNAKDLIKEATTILGGGGGGKPNVAQAGYKDQSKLDECFAKLKALL